MLNFVAQTDNSCTVFSHCRSKRAAYKYAKDRGAVASRWCWLATQISELDYKIRQHTDLRKHIKDNKGAVTLEEIAGFEGQLPGSNRTKAFDDIDGGADGSSARVRPLLKAPFRKRKLVTTENLHLTSKKAARPRYAVHCVRRLSNAAKISHLFYCFSCSTIKCGCQWPVQPCTLCTGRRDPTAPRDLPDTLATAERVALLDPGFHPVLSFPDGEFAASLNRFEFDSNLIVWPHCRRLEQHPPRSHHEHPRMAVENGQVIAEDDNEACHT